MIKQWISKHFCHHEWEKAHQADYYHTNEDSPNRVIILFMCKKCGKFKKIKL